VTYLPIPIAGKAARTAVTVEVIVPSATKVKAPVVCVKMPLTSRAATLVLLSDGEFTLFEIAIKLARAVSITGDTELFVEDNCAENDTDLFPPSAELFSFTSEAITLGALK